MSKSSSDYQKLSAELEEILTWFESGQTNIDDAVNKYEQANKLIAEMESHLKIAENKIRKISVKFNSPSK